MSVTSGPKVNIDGLVLALDASNIGSIKGKRSLINMDSWAAGQTGSVGIYGQNGDGNSRINDTNPWGNTDIVWDVSNQDATSDADGGWNTSNFSIDPTKLYRYSVWVRRKVIGNGSFYLGVYGKNSAGTNEGVLNRSNGAVNTNPYFRSSGWWGSANVWYLVVGHVWPAGSGTGSNHVESGIYDTSGNKIGSNTDYVWQSTNVLSIHRSYLYYSTDITTNQQFYDPRVDVCDGSEPTINDLVNDTTNRWYDMINTSRYALMGPDVSYSSNFSGVIQLARTANGFVKLNGSDFNLSGSNNTVITFSRYSNASNLGGRIVTAWQNNWLLGHHSTSYGNYYAEGWVYNPANTVNPTDWRMFTGTGNISSDSWSLYINDQLMATNNAGSQGPNGLYCGGGPYSQYAEGEIGLILAYNRVLSTTEITQIFNSYRKRFSI